MQQHGNDHSNHEEESKTPQQEEAQPEKNKQPQSNKSKKKENGERKSQGTNPTIGRKGGKIRPGKQRGANLKGRETRMTRLPKSKLLSDLSSPVTTFMVIWIEMII
jgi:hypothetical protein